MAFGPQFAQDTWCCSSSSRGSVFLIFARPEKKTAGPTRGKGQRLTAGRHGRVTRGPPPTTPLGGWSPQVPITAREAKKTAQFGPWVLPPNRTAQSVRALASGAAGLHWFSFSHISPRPFITMTHITAPSVAPSSASRATDQQISWPSNTF
jgi:hypothetical protein